MERISGRSGAFRVHLRSGASTEARRILLAPGLRDQLPGVPGLAERYGTSVFSCPYCDGWEQRDRKLGVLAHGDSAVELGEALLGWSPSVTIFDTRGDSIDSAAARRLRQLGVELVHERVLRLEGEGNGLAALVLQDGQRVDCDALFLKPECTLATACLPRSLQLTEQARGYVWQWQKQCHVSGPLRSLAVDDDGHRRCGRGAQTVTEIQTACGEDRAAAAPAADSA